MKHDHALKRHEDIGIVVLAAGASVRMGSPKQLIKVNGVSLIRRAVNHAIDTSCGPVEVVLGANSNVIAPELNGLKIGITVNREWRTGLSSSIACGLKELLRRSNELGAVILFLADQPYVTGKSLRKLVLAHFQSERELVAASYCGHIGTPALFSQTYFDHLSTLTGQCGAKNLLAQRASDVMEVAMPEAALDVDTPLDFQGALKEEALDVGDGGEP